MLLWFPLMLCLIPNNKRSTDVGDNSKTRNKKVGTFSRKESRPYFVFVAVGLSLALMVLNCVYTARGKALTVQLLLLSLSLSAGSVFVVKVCSSPEEEIPEERESLI
jgi:hypothetical protein